MNPPASFNVGLTGTHAMREVKHLPTRKPVARLCIASGPVSDASARDVR